VAAGERQVRSTAQSLLIPLAEAMDILWHALRTRKAADGWRQCHKVFPEGEEWHWVRRQGAREERVTDPALIAGLDARWELAERVFHSYEDVVPHVRRQGDSRPPRPAEPWEWSCVGLHALWDGWRQDAPIVRAELAAARFGAEADVVGADDEGEDRRSAYELSFLATRVRSFYDRLWNARQDDPAVRVAATWPATVFAFAKARGFRAGDALSDLVEALAWEGIAEREGDDFVLGDAEGAKVRVGAGELLAVARRALGGGGGEGSQPR